jgi:hypothetical protein
VALDVAVERSQRHDTVFTRAPHHVGRELERSRQHEAAVVVGVLADQVGAAGSPNGLGRIRKDAAQPLEDGYAHQPMKPQTKIPIATMDGRTSTTLRGRCEQC